MVTQGEKVFLHHYEFRTHEKRNDVNVDIRACACYTYSGIFLKETGKVLRTIHKQQQQENFRELNLTHVDNLGSKNRRWILAARLLILSIFIYSRQLAGSMFFPVSTKPWKRSQWSVLGFIVLLTYVGILVGWPPIVRGRISWEVSFLHLW